MLSWIIICLVICIILGIIGFSGKPTTAKGMAKMFFFIFLILFLVLLGYYVFQNYFHPQVDVQVHMPSATDMINPFKK